jgi:hypothetical protein
MIKNTFIVPHLQACDMVETARLLEVVMSPSAVFLRILGGAGGSVFRTLA